MKINNEEVGTVKDDLGIAEDSSDIQSEDKIVSFHSPFQDDSSISSE